MGRGFFGGMAILAMSSLFSPAHLFSCSPALAQRGLYRGRFCCPQLIVGWGFAPRVSSLLSTFHVLPSRAAWPVPGGSSLFFFFSTFYSPPSRVAPRGLFSRISGACPRPSDLSRALSNPHQHFHPCFLARTCFCPAITALHHDSAAL
jgi:hypothetical protein